MKLVLSFLIAARNVGVPAVLPIILWFSPWQETIGAAGWGFIMSTYYIAVLFLFFMELLGIASYSARSTWSLAWEVCSPFLWMLLPLLTGEGSVDLYYIHLGLLLLAREMIAFTLLNLFGPFLQGRWKSYTAKDWGGAAVLTGTQLFFLIPGLGALWLLGGAVFFGVYAGLWSGPWYLTLLFLFAYLIPIGQESWRTLGEMQEHSVYAK